MLRELSSNVNTSKEWEKEKKTLKQWGNRRMPFQAAAFGHGILQNLLEKNGIKTSPALSLD